MTVANDFFDRLQGVWQNKWHGSWLDDNGWNFITQPRLGAPGTSDFEMRFDQMRETITFKKLPRPFARNVGITGRTGHWLAMSYEINITDIDDQGIHHEMGHFLMRAKDDSGETHDQLLAEIVRQATIPRANAMMTLGEIRPGALNPTEDIYSARPLTLDQGLQARIDTELAQIQQRINALGGPDLQTPLTWLDSTQPPKPRTPDFADWVFDFRHDQSPSQMAHGQRVFNPVGIGNLLSEFWIGSREVEDQNITTLQYAQKVDLQFSGIAWPHIAVNTLRKQ